MVLKCFGCGKPVTTEIPDNTIFRGIATCPECLSKQIDDTKETIGQLKSGIEIFAGIQKNNRNGN